MTERGGGGHMPIVVGTIFGDGFRNDGSKRQTREWINKDQFYLFTHAGIENAIGWELALSGGVDFSRKDA